MVEILTTQDVLKEGESAVAHVGKRSLFTPQEGPVLWVLLLTAEQLLREHPALWWLCGGSAA